MKLSALIREADTQPWPHGKGQLVGYNHTDPHAELSVCVLGGAYLVTHKDHFPTLKAFMAARDACLLSPITELSAITGSDLIAIRVEYPLSTIKVTYSLWDCITYLNDSADWSFLQIADWLEEQGY